MKIALLGGIGFIATNTAIEAIKRGHTVVAFDNLSRKGVEENLTYMQNTYKDKYEFVWGDVRKRGDFEKIPKDIDAVINFAANPSVVKSIEFPGYDFETNCGGTVNSLDFVRSRGCVPYLYASTNKVYSDITNEFPLFNHKTRYEWGQVSELKTEHEDLLFADKFEDHRKMKGVYGVAASGVDVATVSGVENMGVGSIESINDKFPIDGYGKYGHSLYGIGKLAGELYAQEYHIQFGIPTVIFRMSCIYGLYQKGNQEQAWVDHFLRQILAGETINIFGTGKQVRDVLDGRDTARAYLDALENIDKVNGEIFTLGGGPEHSYSLLETIEIIEGLTGKKAKLTFGEPRPADQLIYVSSILKARSLLNWSPKITLEEGLLDMIKQYQGVD